MNANPNFTRCSIICFFAAAFGNNSNTSSKGLPASLSSFAFLIESFTIPIRTSGGIDGPSSAPIENPMSSIPLVELNAFVDASSSAFAAASPFCPKLAISLIADFSCSPLTKAGNGGPGCGSISPKNMSKNQFDLYSGSISSASMSTMRWIGCASVMSSAVGEILCRNFSLNPLAYCLLLNALSM